MKVGISQFCWVDFRGLRVFALSGLRRCTVFASKGCFEFRALGFCRNSKL